MKTIISTNPHNLPDAGQVIEWHGTHPVRIRLATGIILRLSKETGIYVPENY